MTLIAIFVYYVSPLSKLASIKVVGNEHVTSEAVIQQANFAIDSDFWPQYFDKNAHAKKVEQAFPRIKDAQISMAGINSFEIKVTEFKVAAVSAEAGQETYAPILENGVILQEQIAKTNGLPVLENFTKQKDIKMLLAQYEQLDEGIRQGISEIRYEPSKVNQELLNVYMNDGNKVIVNISELAKKMSYYPQVVEKMEEPGVIDMEVGIYSYPNQTEQTSSDAEDQSAENEVID